MKFLYKNDIETFKKVQYLQNTIEATLEKKNLFKFLNLYQNFLVNTEIKMIKEPISLEEAIADSVSNIKEIAKVKQIYLLWSGGIDSTLVFYAMLSEGIEFHVLTDYNSKREYPFLFEKIRNNEFKNVDMVLTTEQNQEFYQDDKNFFITGEIGDQIVGSMVTLRFNYANRQMLLRDAIDIDLFSSDDLIGINNSKDHKPERFYGKNGTESIIISMEKEDILFRFLGTDRDTTTVSEFLWALNILYKYNSVILRLHPRGLYAEGKFVNTIHFFNTKKFQQYATSHYKENCDFKTLKDYKIPYKNYIYSKNKDRIYRDNKEKEPSLVTSNFFNTKSAV